jgi:hypothetical protein
MAKLTTNRLKTLLTKPGRHGDGAGLYFRVLAEDKAYWVYRYRVDGKEREISIGPFPEISLVDARAQHMALRKRVVVDRADPLADKRAGKEMPKPTGKPTFAEIADAHIAAKGGEWRNARHIAQWEMTLTRYCAPIRNKPVDAIGTNDVLAVLNPLWTKTPETASRLRGRIEVVFNRARALGHIDEDRANPARWKGHLDQILPNPNSRTSHHAAMPYAEVPAFVTTLQSAVLDTAAKALAFLILTAARAGEVLGATWDEIDLDAAVWSVPAARMKMKRPHRVPRSEAAPQANAPVAAAAAVLDGMSRKAAAEIRAMDRQMLRDWKPPVEPGPKAHSRAWPNRIDRNAKLDSNQSRSVKLLSRGEVIPAPTLLRVVVAAFTAQPKAASAALAPASAAAVGRGWKPRSAPALSWRLCAFWSGLCRGGPASASASAAAGARRGPDWVRGSAPDSARTSGPAAGPR